MAGRWSWAHWPRVSSDDARDRRHRWPPRSRDDAAARGAAAAHGAGRGPDRRHLPGGDPDQRDDAVVHSQTTGDGGGAGHHRAVDAAHAGRIHAWPDRKHSRDDWLKEWGRSMSIALTTGQLEAYVAQGFFPFARIGACLMVAPVFGARFVPARTRVLLAVALTALVAPLAPSTGIAPFSAEGVVVVAQ